MWPPCGGACGRHVLLNPCALRRAADDVGQDRLLEAAAGEPAEDRIDRLRLACGVERPELAREAARQRLPPRLAALAVPDEQRRLPPVQLEVAPVEGAELGSAEAGHHERQQSEPVAFDESRQVAFRMLGRVEEQAELVRDRSHARRGASLTSRRRTAPIEKAPFPGLFP